MGQGWARNAPTYTHVDELWPACATDDQQERARKKQKTQPKAKGAKAAKPAGKAGGKGGKR